MLGRNTEKDFALLADAFFFHLADRFNDILDMETQEEKEYAFCEIPLGLDAKRPFGNSDIPADILTVIQAEKQGDDGDGPCWSSEQLAYARYLYTYLPRYMARVWKKKAGGRRHARKTRARS